jgi:hypothetical protein
MEGEHGFRRNHTPRTGCSCRSAQSNARARDSTNSRTRTAASDCADDCTQRSGADRIAGCVAALTWTAGAKHIGGQRVRIAAQVQRSELQRYACAALQFARLLHVDDPASDPRAPRNRQHVTRVDVLRDRALEVFSRLHLLRIQRLAGANRQQQSRSQGHRTGWRGWRLGRTLIPARTLITIGLVLPRLISRPRSLSIAYGRIAGRSTHALILVCGLLARILWRALILILPLIRVLRCGVGRRDLSILRIGRRSCRAPVALLARRRRCCLLAGLLRRRTQGRSQC